MITSDKGVVHFDVVRGSPRFANACRKAAIASSMLACAHASASIDAPLKNATLQPATIAASTSDRTLLDIAPTAAAIKVQKMLSNQTKESESISPEQKQVLAYGIYPPVKTTVRIDGKNETHWTLHPFDVVRLAREAAAKASITEGIKVDPAKVGAVMIAESSMVSRVGWSSNGKTPSFGLAQLEQNTARSLGVKDLNDPRESALAAAKLVAEGLKLARANSGVPADLVASLAYNCSTKLRKELIAEFGANLRLENLPQATQFHVTNMAYGEQRMHQYAKLSDQHEKMAHLMAQIKMPQVQVQVQAQSVAAKTFQADRTVQPAVSAFVSPQALSIVKTSFNNQESNMIPRPSTMSLVSNFASDNANQIRLKFNQVALEKAGHIQPVPMTSQGLNDLRQAISVQIQRLSNDGNPADRSNDFDKAPMGLKLSTMGEQLETVARSFLEKARGAYDTIVKEIKEAMKLPSPSPAQTSHVLQAQNAHLAASVHSMAAVRKERDEQLAAMRAHPGYMPETEKM